MAGDPLADRFGGRSGAELLLYEEGGFFVAHRDTEKKKGMFGTLVISLPTEHTGGDLVVRHQGREATVSLTSGNDPEIRFAAFYADCEHEVLPLTSGHRLCLVYNLIRAGARTNGASDRPSPPDYSDVANAVAERLASWMKDDERPRKLAYLLAHEYTPEGLGFDGLKHRDAAQVQVMLEAARRQGLAAHLAIVHIAEYGMAEGYDGYGYGSRPRWGRWERDGAGHADEPENYELIEAYDWKHTIGEWVDVSGRRSEFGAIPLAEGELLPAKALDDEPPDEIRVSEATGNEGGSYERFYHRAALVLWPEAETTDVLLQAGAVAVVPYFGDRVKEDDSKRGRTELRALARKIITTWEMEDTDDWWRLEEVERATAARVSMLAHLIRLGDAELIREFVGRVVTPRYTGPENSELCRAAGHLKVTEASAAFAGVVEAKAATCFAELVSWFAEAVERELSVGVLRAMARALARALEKIEPPETRERWRRSGVMRNRGFKMWVDEDDDEAEPWPVTGVSVAKFAATLSQVADSQKLLREAVAAMAGRVGVYRPDAVLLPALVELQASGLLDLSNARHPLTPLWTATAELHLQRSGKPPAPPRDCRLRRQRVSCRCDDCSRLMEFARDPDERVASFPLASGRRQHLHNQIDRDGLEMTHETERKGRPYTLVLTKTRWRFEARQREYEADLERMSTLVGMTSARSAVSVRALARQLRESLARAAGSAEAGA